jgi:WD40 repeat protein
MRPGRRFLRRSTTPDVCTGVNGPRPSSCAATVTADPARPEQVTSIAAAGYQDVAFSPDGTLLAAVANTSVMVWNIARPANPVSIPTDANTLEDLPTAAFTSDGRYLAVGAAPSGNGGLGLLALIDMSPASLVDPQEEVPLVVNTRFGNSSLAASAGDTLLTTGYDGAVRLWRMPEPAAAGTEADLSDWGISGDGHLMAAPVLLNGGPNGTPAAGIWDISGRAPVLNATLPGDAAIVGFLGDTSDALLTVGSAGSVSLWNLADPRRPVRTATLGTVAAPYDTAEQKWQFGHVRRGRDPGRGPRRRRPPAPMARGEGPGRGRSRVDPRARPHHKPGRSAARRAARGHPHVPGPAMVGRCRRRAPSSHRVIASGNHGVWKRNGCGQFPRRGDTA